MWGWDLNQEEAPVEASSPQLLSPEAATSSPSTVGPQPVIVPNVETLKEQFQKQESILAHIRETLRENDADLSTKEKQLEMYANKLSQIKSRSKGQKKLTDSDGKSAVRRSKSKDRKDDQVDGGKKINPKGKASELKKQLEENKKQFEERTEKGMTEAKKIESMVEQIRTQVLERDVTIHELQKSIDTPAPPRPKVQTLPRRQKEKPVVVAKWTQTFLFDEGESRLKELEAMVVDLQDTVKQQASVIAARTKAVALLSEDLSKKGKTAVDELEDTRREMRDMQAKFVAVETEFKTSLVEKDNRLLDLEEKLQTLRNENAQLLEKNAAFEAELQNRKSTDDSKSGDDSRILDLQKKVEELTKELDESNKLMIRLKLEHKNKLKAANNKSLEKLKQGTEDKNENQSLLTKIDELVGEKEKLLAKITELEEEKASFLEQSRTWQMDVAARDAEIADLKSQLTGLMDEKKILMQSVEDQNILVDNLHARIQLTEQSNVDVFEIPGDAASRQFDVSNENVQSEIEGLVKEKQELLDRLKHLSSFENIEPEITATSIGLVDREIYEQELAKEKSKSAELEARLERATEKPGSKAMNTLKNKLKKLENDVMKGKAEIEELNRALQVKDQIIEEMNRKSDGMDSAWESGALEDMQKKCLTLESSLLQLTEQCEHLRKENIEVVHQLSGEKVRRIRAEEEVENVRVLLIAAQELEARVQTLEAAEPTAVDAEYANIVLAGKETEIFNLQSSLADKAQALDRIKEELNQVKKEANDLRNAIPERDYEIQQLRSSLQQAQVHINNLENSVTQLKGQINDERNRSQAADDLSAEVAAKEKECEALKLECQKLEAALDFAMMEMTQERTKFEEKIKNDARYVEKVVKQRDELLIKIEESEKVLQKTWNERNELIQTQDRSYKQIMEMERQLAELNGNFQELSLVHAGCQTDALKKELENKMQELENSRKELTVKQQEMESLTVKAKKLAANLKKKAQVEKETQDLVNSLKQEGEILTKQLNANEEIIAEQNRKIKELVNERSNLVQSNVHSNETVALNNEIARLGGVIQGLVSENSEYHSRNQSLIEQIKEKDEMLARAQSDVSGNLEKLDAVSSENNFLKEKLVQFEESLVLAKSEKDTLNELYKKTSGELNALQMAFELEEQENQTLLNQKTDMLKEVEDYVANIKNLQEDNKNLFQKIEHLQRLQGDYNALLGEKTEVEQELLTQKTKMLKEIEEYAANVKNLQEDNQNLLQHLQRLERDYAVLLEEKTAVEQELLNKNEVIISYGERIDELVKTTRVFDELKSKLENEKEAIILEKLNLQDQLNQLSKWEEKQNLLLEEKTSQENERNQLMASVETRLADSEIIINKLETDNRNLLERLHVSEEEFATKTSQMEKEISNFNIAFDAEVQKNAALKGELEALKLQLKHLEQPEKVERKKKKSVTFNTEGADYIKELRGEVASLQRALVESDATVGELKAALGEKPETASETFGLFGAPPAGDFFDQFPSQEANDPFVEDSLQWDDSWGTEGQLEAEHAISKASEENSDKIIKLESELKSLYAEKEAVDEELRVSQVKYAKLIKKLKEQKAIIDRLQGEAKKNSGFGDLEAAMVDEMRSEMAKAEKRESDLRKELDGLQNEHEGLLKKIEVLNLGNEKYLELKERQASDAALWQNQQTELRAEIADLKSQLLAPVDDSKLTQENRELKNLIEGLEWKVSELTEMIDEKEEELSRLSQQGPTITEEKVVCGSCQESSDKLVDVQRQLDSLIQENEDLHEFIRNEMNQVKKVEEPAQTLSSFFPVEQWQKVSGGSAFDVMGSPQVTETPVEDVKSLKDLLTARDQELAKARSLEAELNNLINQKDVEIEQLRNNLEDMQRAYNESKAEIERLLREDQLRLDNPSEEELAQMKQAFELEKSRLESIIKARDLELKSLQETLGSTERDWDETQGHNDDVIQQLKSQLRELDATAARAIEEKDVELQELRAECEELRELCKSREDAMEQLRRELASVSEVTLSSDEKIRNEYESRLAAANEALLEKTNELNGVRAQVEQQQADMGALMRISEELGNLQKRLTAKEADFIALMQQSSAVEAEFLMRDAEARELRAELLTKDSELRELRSEMQELREEVSQIHNFDQQLTAIRSTQGEEAQAVAPSWNMQDKDDLCARLQSDLDATLYHLHQRDVRCSELTLELTQLLEERDVLQLRLSTVIRQNEELRLAVNASSSTDEPTENMRHLAEKISELHTVGYKRDKSFQDESQQRHREQMALLGREARSKNTKPVIDI